MEISPQFVSRVAEELQQEIAEWQNRPLERVYPIVFVDGLRVGVCTDKGVLKKCVYTVLGVSLSGKQEMLGLWIEETEGARFWLKVFNDLKARGTHDLLIVCGDGLTGLRNAVESVSPQADVQLCVVHHIRNVTKFVSWKDRKPLCAAMRPIYTATTLEGSPTWGIPDEALDRFFTELWSLLTAETGLLAEATLRGFNKRPLPNTSGARQIDADLLMLESHKGVYRCDVCRRPHARQTPRRVCTALRCSGHLELEREDPDDFDLVLLDRRYAMVRAREHSAQIPADDCELLERTFKGEGERVNTLVRTPTLELGVDIGGLDAVLMRNVPPLPANLLAASRASRTPSSHGGGFDLCSHPCA